ncbi:MAG: protein tyrosine phosphatase family protein [Leptolyngbyaceae cyanobacterium bins.302]|nr:protein tyrosine phosphatase family protein [Leptolyngbyaceae cyanobacterium bins.302]
MTETIEDLYNYVKVSETIATAGQPTESQFATIKDAGYQMVLNLALPTSSNAVATEQDLVESLGMEYCPIPVQWENPTLDDIEQFFATMQANHDRQVLVHCAANMRVSAFIYLYRILCQKVDPTLAMADLHQIWTPNEIWQQFIDCVIQKYTGST